ncbi:MAG: hypothetical protein RL139_1022 [Gemmatimonadota bacterium]|jgi:hypothetical protein
MGAPRGRRLAPVVVALGLAVGCAELGTDPGQVASIDFTGFPYPAVITGDSLRDSLGVVTPLSATAYDARGAVRADAVITFVSPDTGVTIDALGRLRTTRRPGSLRVFASVDGLQSGGRTLLVTAAPDTVYATSATAPTVSYTIPDAATNLSPELAVALRSRTDVAAPNVTGWLVRWRTVHRGDTLAAGDTTLVALQSTAGRRGAVDTSTTSGASTRRLRIFANRLPAAIDTFTVLAEVRRHGVPVPGSPVRFTVRVAPPAP